MRVEPSDRITRRFELLRENVGKLRELAALPEADFLSDFARVEAAKHLLQTSIEAVIDVAVQILSTLNEPLPGHHAGVFEALSRHGVVPAERVETYRQMVAFRNRVVHLYDRVDDRRVYEILSRNLPDFETFIAEVINFDAD